MAKQIEEKQPPVVVAATSGLMRGSIKAALITSGVRDVMQAGDLAELKNALTLDAPMRIVVLGAALADELLEMSGGFRPGQGKVVVIAPVRFSPKRLIKYLSLGAQAAITDNIDMTDLVSLVRLVHKGMIIYPAEPTGRDERYAHFRQNMTSLKPALSPREQSILELIARGFTEEDTCNALQIGKRTIHTYLERAKGKLNARNRIQAIALAAATGQISPYGPVSDRELNSQKSSSSHLSPVKSSPLVG